MKLKTSAKVELESLMDTLRPSLALSTNERKAPATDEEEKLKPTNGTAPKWLAFAAHTGREEILTHFIMGLLWAPFVFIEGTNQNIRHSSLAFVNSTTCKTFQISHQSMIIAP